MSYEPALQVMDTRSFAENLLAFIEDNQKAAIEWASDEPLAPIAKFYASAAGRLTTVFPCLMVTKRSQATTTEDMLQTAFSIDLELMVSGKDADAVTEASQCYAMAIESLIQNAKVEDLTADSELRIRGTLDTLETDFDVLRGLNASGSHFMQITNFRAVWILSASAY